MGVPEVIGSHVPNFVNDVPRVPKRFEVGIDPWSLSYGFLNEIMDHPCSDGGPWNNKIKCTKFNEGCTKFCKWCTEGSKVRSDIGIDSQTLPYGFQNEIMDCSCSDGVPESDRIGYTKFNKRCTKFNEECTKSCEWSTKGSKVRFVMRISSQSLSYGFQNEIMDHRS